MLSKLARYLLRNNEDFKKLDAMLSKPEDWSINSYRIIHKTGIALWIASGRAFLSIDKPKHIELSLLIRCALWNKIKRMYIKSEPELTKLLKSIELDNATN